MTQEKEKHFTKKTSIQLIFLLVTLFFVVILFTQCSTKQPPLKQPPVKVNRPEPPKPTPPPLPPPAPKKAKDKASEDSIVMGFPCGIEGGVEEGIDFGVEGGAAGGVLGAPPVLGKGVPAANMNMKACGTTYFMSEPSHTFNTEEYSRIYESRFLETLDNPLSTFSIDVDTGSYANVRRFLNHSQLPPEDAGELGAGHTVTALYEIIPTDPEKTVPGPASLRFQETRVKPEAFKTDEIALVKLRYKQPRGKVSQLITHPVNREKQENIKGSDNLRFAAAVAMFGMLLRDSEYAGNATYDNVLSLAKSASEKDKYGYRSEFLRLVSIAKELKK